LVPLSSQAICETPLVTRLRVEVERDHLERLIKKPLGGLTELLWNAIDADATEITADLQRNAMGGIDALIVADNGTGITREQAHRYFSHLGGSWKKLATTTEAGRSLHGSSGQGRWAAYGIGEVVRWISTTEQVTGEIAEIRITGRRSNLDEFDVGDPEPPTRPRGTVVEIEQLTDSAIRSLERDDVIGHLTTTFALTLEQYPVVLYWRDICLDPKSVQTRRHSQEIAVDGVDGPVELIIIEWAKPQKSRSLHLCDAGGASLYEMRAGIQAPGFDFTAYLRWEGFRDLTTALPLAELGQEPLSSLVDAAKDAMRNYFGSRAKDRSAELVAAWKADRSYPFEGTAATTVERAERDLFDIVAVAAAPAVENIDTRSRRFSLRLMREALENSPNSLHDVLLDVLELPADQLEEPRELLDKTSLASIITATRQITDRLDFLIGLEELVFNRVTRKRLLERSQLHRILATETWIFREEYALTADDVTLRTALREHIHLLGRKELAPGDVEASEVLDSDGSRVVVDLMLSRIVEQRRQHREHLVIELKRPTVHIGVEQVMQIQRYAQAVARDGRFAMTDTRWEFWIVGDTLDESVELLVSQGDREPGVISVPGKYPVTVRAVTWAQVIGDARHRLAFVKEALNYSTSTDTALAYLERAHGKYLPNARSGSHV
jgi:hypothetical protein